MQKEAAAVYQKNLIKVLETVDKTGKKDYYFYQKNLIKIIKCFWM